VKSWLITGASGYVASAIIDQLEGKARAIRRLSRISMPQKHAQETTIEDMQGDYADRSWLREAVEGMDVVIHLASGTSVYEAEKDPASNMESTVGITLRLLEACAQCDTPPMFLLAGTATQFGLPKILPVGESHPDNPVTFYDLHKLMAEWNVKLLATRGQVPGCTLRLANVYGPGTTPSSPDRGILNRIISNALKGEAITVYGDGSHLRDYVFIDDIARAFIAAADPEHTSGKHFIIGSGAGHSLAETFSLVAERITLATGSRPRVENTPWPEGTSPIEFRNFVADPIAFQNATGWTCKISLVEGIDRTIAAFLGQFHGMDKVPS